MSLVSKIENRKVFFVLLSLKAVVLGLLIAFYSIHLAPDEAQYWTWSQALDWGYYSKPPGIAWQMALTTALFGNNELGVRFGALIIGFLLPWVLFSTAKSLGFSTRMAFWAGMIVAFSPLGFYLSFAATTDGGATLFFTLAICELAKGLKAAEGPAYPRMGFWVLCGALYKWVAFGAWAFAGLFLIFYPSFRKKTLLLGIGISLLALLPTLYWNASHEWATFKHVGSTIVHKTAKVGGNPLDFFLSQVALLSPFFAAVLGCGMVSLVRRFRRSFPPLLVCATVTGFVLFYFALSLFKKIQPNWALYLYPPGMLVAAWWGIEKSRKGRVWLRAGAVFSIALLIAAICIPAIQSSYSFLPYRVNPFRQNLGWEKLPEILLETGYSPHDNFLFGDKYQTASLLSFYGPGQKRGYFFNLGKHRKNQFSYWPQMAQNEVGKTGYFVLLENIEEKDLSWYEKHYQKRLSPYFEKVHYVGAFPLFAVGGIPVKLALIFRCENYQGLAPPESQKY